MNNPLVDLWQNEIDGVAKSYIRTCAVHGIEKFAALNSLANGASFEAVADATGKPVNYIKALAFSLGGAYKCPTTSKP